MLTIKLRSAEFQDRHGEFYTPDDLASIASKLVYYCDLNYSKKTCGGGFSDKVSDIVINKIKNKNKDKTILVINDFSLHMTNKLLDEGYSANNIYLAYGSWKKGAHGIEVSDDKTLYNIMKSHIQSSFVEQFNIIPLKDVFSNVNFFLIIANPPYGDIGTDITQAILDKVDFDEYLNLLPATNYRLSKTNLQRHVDPVELEIAKGAFEDAAVLPTVGHVHKEEINKMTQLDFRIETQTDPTTKKYFYENVRRNGTYTGMLETQRFAKDSNQTFSKTIFLPMRLASGAHAAHADLASLCRGTQGLAYKVATSVVKSQADVGKANPQCGTYVRFATEEEKRNLGEFLFGDGFKLVLWLLNSMRVDVANKAEHKFWLPRVDWKRKWTAEELLKDYGYSEDEIRDLKESWKKFPDFKKD